MKTLSEEFRAHLSGDVTTLCRCWIITPHSGPKIGFTDHDGDFVVEGVVCERDAGMETSGIERRIGLNVDNAEVSGALQSDRITDSDISAGYYDKATVSSYIVNWQEPEQHVLDQVMLVGEITYSDGLYRMKLRGQSSLLDQTGGRHFIKRCQADLGDSKCRFQTAGAGFTATGVVQNARTLSFFQASGLDSFDTGWFTHGHLAWTTGSNAGVRVEVSSHVMDGGGVILGLWQSMHHTISSGDAFTIIAGCDKSFATCKSKFDNSLNFQGFPHMPGDGFAVTYASNSDRFDGGPVVP